MKIAGRLALITGASSGIGAAAARAMAREGGRILLLARNKAALETVAEGIRGAGGQAWVYPVDIADAAAVARVAELIQGEVGTPDILVNNAGAGSLIPMEETSPQEAVQMMALPYFGAFYITRAFLPAMRLRGSGHLVNITSPAGFIPWPRVTGYAVARWAMRGLHEALRADVYQTQIKTTLIVPGAVKSTYFANNPGGAEEFPGIAKLYRTLSPEEVAEAIVYGVTHDRRQVIVPALLAWTIWAHKFWPGIFEWALCR